MTAKATRRYDSSGRRARAAETAAHIVAKAGRLFSERGYEGTTIAAIAEEAGVSVATVYAQFGNKQSVLEHWLLSVTADAAQSAPRRTASIASAGISRWVRNAIGRAIPRTIRGNSAGGAARKASCSASTLVR